MADAWGGAWGPSWGNSWGASVTPAEDVTLGGGTYQGLRERIHGRDKQEDERWQKRRKQLEKISRLIDGISEELPSDVPEAQVARQAAAAVEKAAGKLAEDVPVPFIDWAGLAAAIRETEMALMQAEQALAAYRFRVEEEDDEDALLMMG